MSFRTMQFPGMRISNIICDDNSVNIEIDYAIIIKNMDDAEQDTRWYGKGLITISDLVVETDDFPEFPATVKSADIKDNQITYRDEANVPMKSHGNVGITIQFEDTLSSVKFIGEQMSLELTEHEKYIEHI